MEEWRHTSTLYHLDTRKRERERETLAIRFTDWPIYARVFPRTHCIADSLAVLVNRNVCVLSEIQTLIIRSSRS